VTNHGEGRPVSRRVFRIPFSRRAVRDDVDAELHFHIEGRVEDLMAKGLSREEAEREARERFGDLRRIESEVEIIDRASQRRQSWSDRLGGLGQDVRSALRGMWRRPLYTLVVVVTLALGIGANTAIFSAVNSLLLHPVPTPALDRIVSIREDLLGLDLLDAPLSAGEALDLFARKDLFQATAAYANGNMNLTGQGEPRRVGTTQTLGEFFTLFGVRAEVGRLFRPEDSAEGGPRVVVLAYGLWQELGGGDPAFIGRSIELDGNRYEVIGVLPPAFRFPRSAQLYRPYPVTKFTVSAQARHSLNLNVLGRLRPGVSTEQVASQLRVEVGRWQSRLGGYDPKSFVLRGVPFVNQIAGELRPILLVLMGAVGLVLLIACANVAGLQLVRAAGRAKEIAVRAALGAGRAAIARQLLVESLALALAGGVLGLGFGELIIRALARLSAGPYEALRDVHLDGRVLAFTAVVAVVAGVLFGIFPALRASRVDLQDALKDAMRGSSLGASRQRLLQGSVVVQIALTLVLLLASVLTLRSLIRLLSLDTGFQPAQLMTMRVSLPYARYNSHAARLAFYGSLLERIRGVPGFESVGLVSYLPFGGGTDSAPFDVPGRPPQGNEPARHANTEVIAGDYFRAMRIPLLRGRTFERGDDMQAPVVIIDEYLARTFFGSEDPIGKQIQHNQRATIIGVVGNVAPNELGEANHATVYHHYPENPWLNFTTLVIRSALTTEAVSSLARKVVRDLDPALPLYDVKPMEEWIGGSVVPQRLAMLVFAGFAVVSLALAVLGIYGVVSYSTAQRTNEIGIRMALGARTRDVTLMVLRNAFVLTSIGLGIGGVIFLAAGRLVASVLYGVSPRDPLTIIGCIVFLSAIALFASYVPARRAARTDPLVALRAQ
jgi:putative ABC transport system permease protein